VTKSRRRFPPPWIVEEYRGISYIVRDANDFPVAYVYFESEPGRRAAANLMTKDEARKIAAEPDMKSVRRMAMNSASKTTPSQTTTDRGDIAATLRPDTSASATAASVVVSLLFAKCHRRQSAAKFLISDEARRMSCPRIEAQLGHPKH
jgi:hypothetical protein